MVKNEVSVEQLRELLAHNPYTGEFWWRERSPDLFRRDAHAAMWNTKFAGREAFAIEGGNGYLYGTIFAKKYLAHRVAWAMHTGAWPQDYIDHIDGNPKNNAITNLRVATASINMRNQRRRSDNTSGVTGVYWNKGKRAFHAHARVEGRKMHLGYFPDLQSALAVRKAAEIEYGFHPNHGRH